MNRFILLVLLLGFIVLGGCREDGAVSSTASAIEKEYFEDYEVPEHKWGFINEAGQVVIKPVYDDVKDVWDNRVAANYEGKWGYLDDRGQQVVDFKYKQAQNFSSQRTFVQDFDNNWLLIDEMGSIVDTMQYETYGEYLGDYVVVGEGNLKGIVNKKAVLVIPLEYSSIKLLDNNTFIGVQASSYGITDITTKEVLLPYNYDRVYSPSNNILKVKQNGQYTYLNATNLKPLNKAYFYKASDFHYDRTIVHDGNSYVLIDEELRSEKVLPYTKVDYVGNKTWKYKEGSKWGLLDKNGNTLTQAKYNLLNRFSSNRLAFQVNEFWGFLDDKGKEVIKPRFVLTWDFHDDRARVIDQRGVGFINLQGEMIVKDMFLEVRDFRNGIARFQTF